MIRITTRGLERPLTLFICSFFVIGWLCVLALIRPPLTRATGASGKSKLLKHDRTRLIEAVAQNKPAVTLMIAARQGMTESLVSEIRGLSGIVHYRDDDVDYLRVELPTRHVLKLSSSTGIESINLCGKIDYLDSHDHEDNEDQNSPPVALREIPAPGPDTAPVNPYLSGGIRPLELTEQQISDLVTFMETLTSPEYAAKAEDMQ